MIRHHRQDRSRWPPLPRDVPSKSSTCGPGTTIVAELQDTVADMVVPGVVVSGRSQLGLYWMVVDYNRDRILIHESEVVLR